MRQFKITDNCNSNVYVSNAQWVEKQCRLRMPQQKSRRWEVGRGNMAGDKHMATYNSPDSKQPLSGWRLWTFSVTKVEIALAGFPEQSSSVALTRSLNERPKQPTKHPFNGIHENSSAGLGQTWLSLVVAWLLIRFMTHKYAQTFCQRHSWHTWYVLQSVKCSTEVQG